MKKIELLFYKSLPSEKNCGMKFVLWEVTDPEGWKAHDWGFCEWNGFEWNMAGVEPPEGFTAKVAFWANPVDPVLLLKEESRIIRF